MPARRESRGIRRHSPSRTAECAAHAFTNSRTALTASSDQSSSTYPRSTTVVAARGASTRSGQPAHRQDARDQCQRSSPPDVEVAIDEYEPRRERSRDPSARGTISRSPALADRRELAAWGRPGLARTGSGPPRALRSGSSRFRAAPRASLAWGCIGPDSDQECARAHSHSAACAAALPQAVLPRAVSRRRTQFIRLSYSVPQKSRPTPRLPQAVLPRAAIGEPSR
jgi:hypothetical protein